MRTDVVVSLLALLLCNVARCVNHCKPRDCVDLRCYRVSVGVDGPHTVYPGLENLPNKLSMSCDQNTTGGGWTIWLRRNATVNNTIFVHTFDVYQDGFGSQNGDSEFCLGNEIVHRITTSYPKKNGEVRIGGVAYDGNAFGMSANKFHLKSAKKEYAFVVLGEEFDSINVGTDTLHYHHNAKFTLGPSGCTDKFDNALWWFNTKPICARFYMFGKHSTSSIKTGKPIYIQSLALSEIQLKTSYVMFRPYDKDRRLCDNPCMNGGTCEFVEDTKTHRCICDNSHCGLKCEKSNNCVNGGTCVYNALALTNYTCTCREGFFGDYCGSIDSGPSTRNMFFIPIIAGFTIAITLPLTIFLCAVLLLTEHNKRIEHNRRLTLALMQQQPTFPPPTW